MREDLKEIAGCFGIALGLTLAISIGLAIFVAPGVLGWFIADKNWHQGDLGAFAPYIVAGLAALIYASLTDLEMRAFVVHAAATLLAAIPLLYILTLILEIIALPFDPAQYNDLGHFFVASVPGVLIASGLAVLLSLKGAAKIASDRSSSRRGRLSLTELFFEGMALRIPFGLLVPAWLIAPDAHSARIASGMYLGLMFAVTAMMSRTLINKEPLKEIWWYIILVEALLAFVMFLLVLDGVAEDKKVLALALETIPYACAACLVTYALGLLAARLRRASQRWFVG